jgi:hypothetical protein
MHQRNDDHAAPAHQGRRLLRYAFVPIAAVALLFASPHVLAWWQDVTFARAVKKYLRGDVDYVEFQPNSDWPKQRITAPERHKRLLEWLRRTHEESRLRSAPPACVCELRFVFRDGRDEVLRINALREPLTSEGHTGVRNDARFYFHDHCRNGDVVELTEILQLD